MVASVRLAVSAAEVQARPGDRVGLALTVKNAGPAVDRFRVALSGIPAAWYDLEPATLSLFPDASGAVALTLAPPAGLATAAGAYPLTLTATSEQDPRVQASALATLVVPRGGALSLAVSPASAAGRQASYRITLANDANAPATLAVQARDLEGALLCTLSPGGPVTVPPGEQRTLALAARPALAPTVGEPHLYEIEVAARPEGHAAGAASALVGRAGFTFQPQVRSSALPLWARRMPVWALLLLPLALLALVFTAGARTAGALTGGTPTPPPAATATSAPSAVPTATAAATGTTTAQATGTTARPAVPAPRIASFGVQPGKGGAVLAAWSTSGGSGPGAVTLNGKPVPPSGSVPVPAAGSGPLVLRVSGAGGSTTRTLIVAPAAAAAPGVAPAVAAYLPRVAAFALGQDPRTGKPTLRWQVAGATAIAVDGKAVPAAGSEPLARPGPATYVLAASNRYGSVTTRLAVPAPAAAALPPRSLVLHPPAIGAFALRRGAGGQGASLVWATSGATSVLLNGKKVGASGSLPLGAPQPGASFDLVAANADGASRARVTVALAGGGSPARSSVGLAVPRIGTFALAVENGAAVVRWEVTGAQHVALDGAAVPAVGSRPVPPGLGTLTLVAGNDVGVQQRQIAVPPTATASATPAPPTGTAPPGATATKPATAAKATASRTPAKAASATPTRAPSPTGSATARPTASGTALRTATPPPTSTRPGVPRATATGTPRPLAAQPASSPTGTSLPVSPTATYPRALIWTATPTAGTPRPGVTPSPTGTAPPGSTATATATTAKVQAAITATATPVPPSATATPVPPTASFTATASPTGTRIPSRVTLSPTSLHFPVGNPAAASAFATQTVTVTNAGPSPLVIGTVTLTGPDAAAFAQSGCANTTLDPNKSCTVSVGFVNATTDAGDGQGNYTASLSVADDGAGSPQTAAITAGPRTIGAAPDTLTLASAAPGSGGPQEVATVTVTNNGPGPLQGVTAAFQPGGSGFSAQVGSACANLKMGGACTVTVGYTFPQGAGGVPATTLVLTPVGGAGTVSIPLTVTLPSWTVSPASPVSIGVNEIKTFTVTNNGPGPLTNIAFSLSSNNNFRAGGNCPSSLSQGQTCQIFVDYCPMEGGGAGINAASLAEAFSSSTSLTITALGNPPAIVIQINGVLPSWSVSPSSSPVQIDADTSKLFTVTNNGPGDLTNIFYSTNDSAFTPDSEINGTPCTSGTTLHVGGTCQFAVFFSPQQAGQHHPGTLTVYAQGNPNSMPITLDGFQGPSTLSISPLPGDDGYVDIPHDTSGQSGTQSFTLTNTGQTFVSNIAIQVNADSGSTGSFGLLSNTCGTSLAPNAANTCTFTVKFTVPSSEDPNLLGTLTVTSDASNSPLTVRVKGVVQCTVC